LVQGAPDWSQIFMIRALDEEGELHDVLVDDQGRLLMLAYGTVTVGGELDVNQLDSVREIQGADGEDLHTLAVDSLGRLVMLPYGWTGTAYKRLRVDDLGRMFALMTGTDGEDYLTLRTDDLGRMIALFRDPVSDNYAAISGDGFLSAILRGGSDIRLDLELWYRFRASEGAAIQDYSGNDRDGVSTVGGASGATYVDGVVGDALYFSGVNDYVTLPTSIYALYNAEDHFSVELWVQSSAVPPASSGIPWGCETAGARRLYLIGLDTGYWRFDIGDHASGAAACAIEAGWHHFIITVDKANVVAKTYYDGALIHTDTGWSWTNLNDVDMIGALGPGAIVDFAGDVDEFRVYSHVLSAEEVLWRYKRTHVSLDERYRPLSVDPEGRLEVSVADFAYKDQVLERGSTVYGSGGNQNEQSAVCPAGKMWVITAAEMHSNGSACTSMDIGIYDGSDNHIVASDLSGANVFQVNYQGQLILKPGDRLNFAWGHAATAYVSDWTLNGYELDYPY